MIVTSMQLTISSRRDIAVLQKESSSLQGEEDVKALAESPGNVIVGSSILRRRENLARRAYFHEFTHEHEAGDIRHPRRLL